MRALSVASLALALSASFASAADGDFDPTYGLFNSGKNVIGIDLGAPNSDVLSDMVLAPDGSAYLIGTSDYGNGHVLVSATKATPQGAQDQTFNANTGYRLFGPTNSDSIAAHASLDAQGNALITATQYATPQDGSLLLVGSTPDGHAVMFGQTSYIAFDYDLQGTNADSAAAVLQLPNGEYIVAGSASTLAGTELAVARFNADGTPDAVFGGGSGSVHYSFPNAALIQITSLAYHDGKLLVAGTSRTAANQASDMFIARLLVITGAKDTNYGAGGACLLTFNEGVGSNDDAGITSLVVQNDDIYAGGYAQTDVGRYKGVVVKLAHTCSIDQDFGNSGRAFLQSGYTLSFNKIAVQGDGKVIAVGTRKATSVSDTRIDVARFNADGTLDTAFATLGENVFGFGLAGGSDHGMAVAVDSQRIYVAGYASQGSGNYDFVIAGLKNDLIFANNFDD